MKTQSIYPIVLIWMISALLSGKDKSLFILHTNNTNGALENCYCPDHPLGSLEKRAVFIESFLDEHPNTIVVDAGDFFSPVHRPLKDSLVVEAYSIIPYDAILPGDQELTRGQANLEKILRKTGADLVISNYQSPWLRGAVRRKIIERNNIKIAVLGILGTQAFKYYPKEVRESFDIQDPLPVINRTLEEIRGIVDVVVILTHQGYESDVILAKKLRDVDVIIGAHTQTTLIQPKLENDILIAQAGKNGYYVGIIELKPNKQNRRYSKTGWLVPMEQNMPDHPFVMELIREYEIKSGFVNRAKLKHGED